MRLDVLTIFPEWFDGPLQTSLLGKAIDDGRLDVRVHDLRAVTTDRHRTVDAAPYGGGAGMVMRADVWIAACEAVWNDRPPASAVPGGPPPDGAAFTAGGPRPRTVLLTPRGRPLTQELAQELAREERLVLLCGRYEGIDERVHELVATDEVSVGDYVLFGGEVAAATVIEAVTRLVPGVLGNDASPQDESFTSGLLEYPQYTRPPTVRGVGIPDVLTSGDHGAVDRWRLAQAQALTEARRPDLLAGRDQPRSAAADASSRGASNAASDEQANAASDVSSRGASNAASTTPADAPSNTPADAASTIPTDTASDAPSDAPSDVPPDGAASG